MDLIKSQISEAWLKRTSLSEQDLEALQKPILSILEKLDKGELRIAERQQDEWIVHQWLKMAILLSFRLFKNREIWGAPSLGDKANCWFDKIPLKSADWDKEKHEAAGFRSVPGSIVRYGSFVSKGVILMPCFVNVGAYIGEGTLIDTWSTVGSCAQVGKNCHISGGVGIGGVLEPLQANPVIIEDDCFIGARSEIAEGVIVEKGAVISMGVYLGASTKIVNRDTGEISYGRIPPYSVVIPGTLPGKTPTDPSLACAVIVKQVDEKTRGKTSLNELLRA